MKKILVMKFRNIGDVLLITPLLENLKLAFPDAIIDVALNEGTQEMIRLNPYVDTIRIYDRAQIKSLGFFKRIYKEIAFAYSIREKKYDIVINTTEGDRGAQLALFSGAKIKIGYKPNKNKLLQNVFTHLLPPQEFRHTIECNLDALRVLNLPVKEKKVAIYWAKEDEDIIDSMLVKQDFIHIHPVSRWLFKCINDTTMAEIIDFCKNTLNQEVILTASNDPFEIQKIEAILAQCTSNPLNFAGKLTLKQTAALNKKAKMFIGVDTAIMHMSAANDTPVLAFFGPSGADHWGPWDNELMQSGYTTRKGIRTMGKHTVIQEDWDCVPCGKDGCNGTKVSDCLMHLDLNTIQKTIKKMLS
ncbi:putative lipopolysaccharide heptosyltransferase III [Sulfurospirillum sp. 1612]|uniref:putative lipopolysaccharide heptosyltransferase III n=1 Tax=Sulfurospirillum sp. 1612 TaxID=3094835 RepID=UPI002F938AEF